MRLLVALAALAFVCPAYATQMAFQVLLPAADTADKPIDPATFTVLRFQWSGRCDFTFIAETREIVIAGPDPEFKVEMTPGPRCARVSVSKRHPETGLIEESDWSAVVAIEVPESSKPKPPVLRLVVSEN